MSNEADETTLRLFKEELDAGASPEDAKRKALSRRAALDAIGAGSEQKDYGAPVPFRPDYLATPSDVRAAKGETVGKPEAAARAAARGVTLRNNDEIVGYLQTEGANPATEAYRIAKGIPGKTNPNFEQERRANVQAERTKDVAAEQDQPWTSRIVEPVAAGAVAPAFGGAKTAGQSVVTAMKMGAPYAFGASNASMTDEPGRLALETGGGTLASGAAGLGAYGLTKAVGYGVNKLRDAWNDFANGVPRGTTATEAALQGKKIPLPAASERAAKETGQAIAARADAPSALGEGTTVRTEFERSQALQKTWNDILKQDFPNETFQLDPAQATGSRAAALRQMRLRQMPGTMDQAQAEYAKQLTNGARILDKLVDGVAADPAKLGRSDVSKGIADTLKRNIKNIYTSTSEQARPYYTAYENTAGGVDASPIVEFYREEIAKRPMMDDAFTKQLQSTLARLEKTGAGGGLSVVEANNMRKLAGETIAGQSSMFDGVDMDVQGAFAGRLRSVIDGVFDAAEKTGPADAVKYLRKANAIWSAGQKAAEEAKTATVMRVIGATAKDPGSTERLPRQMLTMGEDQVRGIFRLLNETDPGVARQARAQMLEEALRQVGKPARDAVLTQEVKGTRLAPARAFGPNGVLTNTESALQASFEGDAKAQFALRHTFYLLKRLSFGPGLEGSQTASLAADAVAEQGPDMLAALANISGIGKTARAVIGVLGNVTGDNKALADALVTPQGIKATNAALAVALKAKGGEAISETAARSAMALLTSAGIIGADEFSRSKQKPQRPAPQPPVPMQREPLPEGLVGLGRGQPIAGEAYQ